MHPWKAQKIAKQERQRVNDGLTTTGLFPLKEPEDWGLYYYLSLFISH